MKKYIVMSIIAVVALLPLAAWADTGGSAEATLTFDSVINTIVTDDWGPLAITQPDIEAFAGGPFPILWGATDHSVTVKIQALTGFAVYSSYSGTSSDLTLPGDLLDEDSFLYLYNAAVSDVALPWRDFADPAAHGLTNTQASGASDLVQLTDWTGTSNISTAGESHTYDVKWDPSELLGLEATDAMTLEIFFIVTDTDT